MKIFFAIASFTLFFNGIINAQFNDQKFGLAFSLIYTTSADIFLNPNSSDPVVRNQPFTLEDILSYGIDLRYRFSESVLFGISSEYMQKSGTAPNLIVFSGNQVLRVNTEDGFQLIPLEGTIYYYLPFSTENFKFVMGGGGGFYYGKFSRNFSSANAEVVERKFAVGIHVCASMDYIIFKNISTRFEMKFRDPEFKTISKYSPTEVEYLGNTVQLSDENFETKVNVNGISFTLAVVYQF
jgi:hypothetical protein